jgi:predicted Rossmann fold nucleotide-binding protein DprA/Smf involved in DNA uptake
MLTKKRVAVVGSRKFSNWEQLNRTLNELMVEDDEIVSGGAIGADSMAQRWAKENGFLIHIYYPNWERNGKGAGFIRNRKIAENSDIVLAFYAKDAFQAGGTLNTANYARQFGKDLREYEEE